MSDVGSVNPSNPRRAEPDTNGNPDQLQELLQALQAMRSGDFSVRMTGDHLGIDGKIADTFNEIVAANQRMAQQLERVGQVVGREGKTRQHVRLGLASGSWADMENSVNTLIDDLLWPTWKDLTDNVNFMASDLTAQVRNIADVATAIAGGDVSKKITVDVSGEILLLKDTLIRVFVDLYRKTRQLERFNAELEDRVRARTKELEHSNARLLESEQRRSLALAAGSMGSWDWDWLNGDWMWDEGQYRIFGVDPKIFAVTPENVRLLLYPADMHELRRAIVQINNGARSYETEFRIVRPDGEIRWLFGTAAVTADQTGRVIRVSGVTVDITERKRAEERQNLLTREVDHRAKNALALAQSIVRLTRGESAKSYMQAVEGRIGALARVHTILSLSSWQGAEITKLVDEELAPYHMNEQIAFGGTSVQLQPATAQTLAMALHELVTNSAKYGALSTRTGHLAISWRVEADVLRILWEERDGPPVVEPVSRGFGTRSVIASIESQLGGQAEFDWRPEGLICRLSVPLKSPATTRQTSYRQPVTFPGGERTGTQKVARQ